MNLSDFIIPLVAASFLLWLLILGHCIGGSDMRDEWLAECKKRGLVKHRESDGKTVWVSDEKETP